MLPVASFAEAWIEIKWGIYGWCTRTVASFAEAWIEIIRLTTVLTRLKVASFAEAWIEILSLSASACATGRLLRGGVD